MGACRTYGWWCRSTTVHGESVSPKNVILSFLAGVPRGARKVSAGMPDFTSSRPRGTHQSRLDEVVHLAELGLGSVEAVDLVAHGRGLDRVDRGLNLVELDLDVGLLDEVRGGRRRRALDVGLLGTRPVAQVVAVVRRVHAGEGRDREGVQHLLKCLTVVFELLDAGLRRIQLVLEVVRVGRAGADGLRGLRGIARHEGHDGLLAGENRTDLLEDGQLDRTTHRGVGHEVIHLHDDVGGGLLHGLVVAGRRCGCCGGPVDSGDAHDACPFRDCLR